MKIEDWNYYKIMIKIKYELAMSSKKWTKKMILVPFRISLYLFLFSVFISCHSGKDEIISDAINALDTSIAFNKKICESAKNSLEMALLNDPNKFGPHWKKAVKIDSLSRSFFIHSDNILKQSMWKDSFNVLADAYYSIYDSIIIHVDHKYREKLSHHSNMKTVYFKENSSYAIKRMQNDILMLQYKALYRLWYIYDPGCGWRFPTIRTEELTKEEYKNRKYIFSINSPGLYHRERRDVIIDTIMQNGKIVMPYYYIINDDAIAAIELDSLPKGNYMIRGRIRVLYTNGDIEEPFPFKHTFEIK